MTDNIFTTISHRWQTINSSTYEAQLHFRSPNHQRLAHLTLSFFTVLLVFLSQGADNKLTDLPSPSSRTVRVGNGSWPLSQSNKHLTAPARVVEDCDARRHVVSVCLRGPLSVWQIILPLCRRCKPRHWQNTGEPFNRAEKSRTLSKFLLPCRKNVPKTSINTKHQSAEREFTWIYVSIKYIKGEVVLSILYSS